MCKELRCFQRAFPCLPSRLERVPSYLERVKNDLEGVSNRLEQEKNELEHAEMDLERVDFDLERVPNGLEGVLERLEQGAGRWEGVADGWAGESKRPARKPVGLARSVSCPANGRCASLPFRRFKSLLLNPLGIVALHERMFAADVRAGKSSMSQAGDQVAALDRAEAGHQATSLTINLSPPTEGRRRFLDTRNKAQSSSTLTSSSRQASNVFASAYTP